MSDDDDFMQDSDAEQYVPITKPSPHRHSFPAQITLTHDMLDMTSNMKTTTTPKQATSTSKTNTTTPNNSNLTTQKTLSPNS